MGVSNGYAAMSGLVYDPPAGEDLKGQCTALAAVSVVSNLSPDWRSR